MHRRASNRTQGDELDDSESGSGSDGGGDEEGAGGGEGAGEGPQPAAGQEEGGATAVAAGAGAAGQQQQEGGGGKKRRRGRGADGRPKLRFAAGPVPRGGPPAVTSTYYRHVMSFTAEDPRPLVPGAARDGERWEADAANATACLDGRALSSVAWSGPQARMLPPCQR